MIIKRLNYFDTLKLKKLMPYISTDNNISLTNSIAQELLSILNNALPLNLKFQPETFIVIDKDSIQGLITVCPTQGNPAKVNITALVFRDNNYEIGRGLVEFVIHRFGAKGASTFTVSVDVCHQELLDLFVNQCGFRQCSSEILWKIPPREINKNSKFRWRTAQKSDGKQIAQLYNSEVNSVFKPSLLRSEKEFEPLFFAGFEQCYKNRYLTEECGKIIGYYSISTYDNVNFIFDITVCGGYELDYGEIIDKMLCEVASHRKVYYAFVKQKCYLKDSESFGAYLNSQGFQPVQTHSILVKDFYKPVQVEQQDWKVFILGETGIS